MNKILTILVLFFSLLLVSCGQKNGGENTPPSGGDTVTPPSGDKAELTTQITDSLTLTKSYEGKSFINDGIGEVVMKNHVDGDTTKFYDPIAKLNFSLRYYGIDTPESTAKIDPWGFAASNFTKTKLKEATKIVLDRDTSDQMTGSRYLGHVWIQDSAHPNFYNLNLLIVEQAYSENEFYDAESTYFPYFEKAGLNAKATGERVYGTNNDPHFDYTGAVRHVTIEELYKDFDQIKLSGQKLVVYGVITRFIPGGFYLRSFEKNEDTETNQTIDGYSNIYCYLQMGSLGRKFKPGTAIKIYGRANEFHGNIQLSDIETSSFAEYKPEIIDDTTRVVEYAKFDASSVGNESKYMYKPVSANVEVTGEKHVSDNGDQSVKVKFIGSENEIDLRIPKDYVDIYSDFLTEGKQISVRGILTKFYPVQDGEFFYYQIQICKEILGEEDFKLLN